MVTLRWYNETFTGDSGLRLESSVILYNSSFDEIVRIEGIYGDEWLNLSFSGDDWTDNPNDIPSKYEILEADFDYLEMMNESLEQDNEQLRADMDYCLMLLEDSDAEAEQS